jgi:hypothetical protein
MMPELAEIPQQARDRIAEIGGADVVIGILAAGERERFNAVIADIRDSAPNLYPQLRTVVVHSPDQSPPQASGDAVRLLPYPLFPAEGAVDGAHRINQAYQSLFVIGRNLEARVIAAVVSDLENVTPVWISRLVHPALNLEFDLVAPCYTHSRYEGLLNSSIVSPLTRALYGKRIQHPLGPDFGVSRRLVNRLLLNASASQAARPRSLASVTVDAVCDGFEVCEANVGARRYPEPDWMNQSPVLVQILGPIFNEAEQHAPFWQRVRASEPIPLFGEEIRFSEDHDGIDTARMIESFQLGCRNLPEIWGAVLPPGALLELTKLARLTPENFRVPDALWARIIYDFALGHRLRIINQDHLLRAMTPLYLAWVASYALELGSAPPDAIAQRLEQLSLAFEAAKPYALSRWRWPDRFNP